jgi:hypothetical protein
VIDTSDEKVTLDEYDAYMLIRNDTLEIMSDESKTEIYPIKDMLM